MTISTWFNLIEGLSALAFWLLVFRRIVKPYKCQCEATFWFFHGYKKHVLTRHGIV
jgi:hypothetical protein